MHYSPLRYPGGKGKIAPFIKDFVTENQLQDSIYIEPFAGGAGIALDLLFEEYVQKIILNDIDRSIYSFWYSVLNHTNEFCKLILQTDLNITEWRNQKEIQQYKENADILDLGFSTFYLNRTNRSGIINGGVIGGISQKGKWKIDARYNKVNLIQRIQKIAKYNQRIELYNYDAIDFIKDVVTPLPRKNLIYFDPPYYHKGQNLYVNHYTPNEHTKLHNVISTDLEHYWILTYDNTPEIEHLYSKYRSLKYNLNYSAGKNSYGSELMFFSQNCQIPLKIQLSLAEECQYC